jgi:hypothetical protein
VFESLVCKGNVIDTSWMSPVAREAGFSDKEKITLREAITVLKVHTVSNITTLDGTQIKPGIADGILEDRTSFYRFPRPLPWSGAFSRIMQKNIHRLTVSTKRLIVKLEEFDLTVHKSQKYLFHIDPTSDRLVDSRGRTRVEHQLGRARRTVQRFGYPDLLANATYKSLHPADVHLGDKWLMVGNVIKEQPLPPPRRKRAPAPYY